MERRKDPLRRARELLGIPAGAGMEEVRRAFRRRARELHPDLRPGDPAAEERFKRLVEAVAAVTASFGGAGERAVGEKPPGTESGRAVRREGRRKGVSGGGRDVIAPFDVSLGEAARGGVHELRLRVACPECGGERGGGGSCQACRKRGSRTVEKLVQVRVPAGSRDGDVLRLAGEGAREGGRSRGDLLVRLAVRAQEGVRIEGDDVHVELPLTIGEAWAGGGIEVPTPAGAVVVTVPPGVDGRAVLRLRGRGLRRRPPADGGRGDLLLHPILILPDRRDERTLAAMARLADGYSFAPRRSLLRVFE
ncbi:MAG: J domain-containing protein [Deltaproteobacteria bacterium]|nr:J domain-containing protein [Deltaproteobacteria bacterium]